MFSPPLPGIWDDMCSYVICKGLIVVCLTLEVTLLLAAYGALLGG